MVQTIPYCGPAPAPETLLSAWNFGVLPLLVCLAPVLATALSATPRWPAATLASAALFVAFVSPVCALTVALFAARGVHHMFLVLVAAPALAMAWPRAMPGGLVTGFIGLSVALWLWHLPAAYTLAWDNPVIYWTLQLALIGCGWAFWAEVLHPRRQTDSITAVVALLALAGQMGLIGAILTFAPGVLYVQHLLLAPAFGLDALADQQLGGLVMWVPGMLPLVALGGFLLHRRWRDLALA